MLSKQRQKKGGGGRLTPAQQLVLGCIAAQTATAGEARFTKRGLAREVNRSEKTIDRAIARLRRLGMIEVEARYDENGAQLANAYRTVSGAKSR